MNTLDIIPRYGDLYNPPLLHGCLGCGAFVQPDADNAIPALCDACQAEQDAPPPVKLYHTGTHYQAPPTAPETAWDRLIRLGDKAVDANGVQVRAGNREYTRFLVSSQSRPGAWYSVRVEDEWVACECTAVGACGHIGAVYRWLLAQQAALHPVIYGYSGTGATLASSPLRAGKAA